MKGAARLTRALLLGGICLFLVSQTVDAEVKPASPFATTQNAPVAPPTAAPFQAPGPLGRLFAWIFDKQQSLQRSLATGVKSLKIDNPLDGAITLALLSFVYGLLHAVGPGHGKTIISSYVIANEETVRRGVIISFIAAGLQGLTAVVLVGVFLIALGATGLQVNAWSNQLETISYAMIALVGLYLLSIQLRSVWRRWQGDTPTLASENIATHSHADHHHQDHDDGHHHHHHDHHHHAPGEACDHGRRAATCRPGLLAQDDGRRVLGRHQAVHRRDPRSRLCADAGVVLGGRGRHLRHGARHGHHRRRVGHTGARLARNLRSGWADRTAPGPTWCGPSAPSVAPPSFCCSGY